MQGAARRATQGAAVLLLAGCATPSVQEDYAYSRDMPNAFVVVGAINAMASTTLTLLPVDPETCRSATSGLDTGTQIGFGSTFRGVGQLERRMIELPPGSYVLADARRVSGSPIISFNDSAFGFTVEAGQIVNLGEFMFSGSSFGHTGTTTAGLSDFMAQYPNVGVRPRTARSVETPFSREREGPMVPGCAFSAD